MTSKYALVGKLLNLEVKFLFICNQGTCGPMSLLFCIRKYFTLLFNKLFGDSVIYLEAWRTQDLNLAVLE